MSAYLTLPGLHKHHLSSVFSFPCSAIFVWVFYLIPFICIFKMYPNQIQKIKIPHGLRLSENIKLFNAQTPGFSDLKLSNLFYLPQYPILTSSNCNLVIVTIGENWQFVQLYLLNCSFKELHDRNMIFFPQKRKWDKVLTNGIKMVPGKDKPWEIRFPPWGFFIKSEDSSGVHAATLKYH